jgi:hypothetical protein
MKKEGGVEKGKRAKKITEKNIMTHLNNIST